MSNRDNPKANCGGWFESIANRAAVNFTLLIVVFLPLFGCATVPDTKTASGRSVEAQTERLAVPQEVERLTSSRSSVPPASSNSAGDFLDKVGKHATAAVKCGWLGARFGMEAMRFLNVLGLPLIPAGAIFGVVAGAYEGESCELPPETKRSP